MYSSNKSQISGWLRNNIREPKDYDAYDLQLRAFFQKMEKMNFQPKVKQLEQLKIEFDDYEASGVGLQLPKVINSKKKFDVGPSNNQRQKFNPPAKKQAFGFVQRQPDSDVDEEVKETAKSIFGGKKEPTIEQQLAKATLRDPTQNTITRMVKQFNEKKPAHDTDTTN
jgi:hypothetical protein